MMKKYLIIVLATFLTACNSNKQIVEDKKYEDNFTGYYERVQLIVYEDDKLKNISEDIYNQYLQITDKNIISSYMENEKFVNQNYDYTITEDNELIISRINNSWDGLTGTYKIYHERTPLNEYIILVSKGPNITIHNRYKMISEDEYLIKHDEVTNNE